MSIEFQESLAMFEKFIRDSVVPESIEQNKLTDIAEMAQEIEKELLDAIAYHGDSKNVANFRHFCQPSDDEVMSYDLGGNVLSHHGDPVWYKFGKSGIKNSYYFTADRGDDDAYRTDPQARPLVLLEKLMLHASWPDKDLTLRPFTDASLSGVHKAIRMLLSWFYMQGYFLSISTDNVPHDNKLIAAEEVRSEIVSRTSEDFLLFHLISFLSGVRLWTRFAMTDWCPEWFCPTFTYRDIFDKRLVKDIAQCIATKRNPWEAIDFVSLQPLFSTAKNYLELYAGDLFWLLERFETTYELSKARSHTNHVPKIASNSRTSNIYNEICGRAYALDPQTGHPWFTPKVSSKARGKKLDGTSRVNMITLKPFVHEVRCLIGAATFVLFSFTGMRHWEMKTMKTGALLIDGKKLDETGDVFAQVDAGTTFDICRTIFKFKSSPSGEQHITPIPKIAAKAYAVLVKVFTYSRRSADPKAKRTPIALISDFLFPSKGLKFKWHARGYGGYSDTPHFTSVHNFLKRFCDAAGVDYIFPHQCRKTLATLLINNDPECLEVIRWLLGHNSILMTYEYVMSLPGIRDEVLQYLRETNIKNLAEFIGDTLTGQVAGAAGNRALDAVVENLESWKGKKLQNTIKILIKSYDDANFCLVRTPAAWCVRFPCRVPHNAPCLPPALQEAIRKGETTEPVIPRFEHCVPWECGDAGHTRSDLATAKRSHMYASRMAANGSGKVLAHYKIQTDYWEKVAAQLEDGRQDVTGELILIKWANS